MPLKPLALLLKPHILYLYLCICVFVFVYLCICVFVYLHICIINWCTEEEKLHDQIVLFQPLFLNLILDISFEYFQPQRVLIKNWTCKTKITRNWSKNFHFHRRCKSFWGKFYQKIFQVSSGLFSYLPLPRTQKMATRASILVPSRHSGFFGKYGLRPLFLHSWPHFHPANNGKCRPSRSVNIPPPAHRWYIWWSILTEILAPPLLALSHSTQNISNANLCMILQWWKTIPSLSQRLKDVGADNIPLAPLNHCRP